MSVNCKSTVCTALASSWERAVARSIMLTPFSPQRRASSCMSGQHDRAHVVAALLSCELHQLLRRQIVRSMDINGCQECGVIDHVPHAITAHDESVASR